ncbi:MAG: hypothetical protein AB7S74_18185 [Hyphomicrobium sp.]
MEPSGFSDRQDKDELERLAQTGNIDAQLYLGWAYDRFGTLPYNESRAEYWLRCAAGSGSSEGRRRLARFFLDRNNDEAVSIANSLVSDRDFYGHYILGHIYLNGNCGQMRNRELALREWCKASEMGHLVSEIDLKKELLLRSPSKLNSLVGLMSALSRYGSLFFRDRKDSRLAV